MYSLSRWKASIFVLSDWERGSHMEDWVRSLFGLAGGLALFLYGMTTMSRALQQAAGERLRGFLRRVTRTPLTGALAGLAVTSILQSSSAATVMVIGFVSAGLMGLPQAVAVVFGANVGTTMTAQLVAFRLEDWVFPLLFVGVLVWSLARREPTRQLGLAVFGFGLLFDGIEVMSGAMAPLAVSPVFLRWMAEVRRAPLLGLALGTGMTLVVQSSSAVTVLVLGLVGAGLLTLQRAVPVVFGANIGTTVTAQLLAFRLEDARYLLLVAGLLLWFAGRGRLHAAGQALFAFGLLFEGIAVMAEAMEPLAAGPVFRQWMAQVRHRPGLGLLAGLGMTLAVQSSSATIAVLQQAAARPGPDGGCLLGLAGAIPVLLGDNIGTTVTAVLASVGQSRDAKRLAAAHALFNLSGAAVCWLLLPQFTALVRLVSPHGPESAVLARQIANAHTLFNLGCTVLWLPLTPCMVRIVCILLPEKHAPLS